MDKKIAYRKASAVLAEIRKSVTGKDPEIQKAFAAILAGGHILIEDVPGVGKTTLAMAFSKAMALENHRVQFTPDVMPADIIGFQMYNKETGLFQYRPGAILCNLFLADEINRTSPKTQSALLEVMEEGIVTVDGKRYKVPDPFIVMATQNPKGSAGTQLLPESQLDRFMICMSMGYPQMKDEIAIAKGKSTGSSVGNIHAVIQSEELVEMRQLVEEVYVHDHIYTYIARLISATRNNGYIDLGVSPRGTIACVRLVKAHAFLQQRDYVTPEDVEAVFPDVATHRLVLNSKARATKITADAVIHDILGEIKKPATYMERTEYHD